jgi:hypothetical protein
MRELPSAAVLDEGAIHYRMQPVGAVKLRSADLPRAKRLGPPRILARAADAIEVTARFVVKSEQSQPALLIQARGEALRLERVEAAVREQALEILAIQALPCTGFHLYVVEIARAPFCASRRSAIALAVRRCFDRSACNDQPELARSSAVR